MPTRWYQRSTSSSERAMLFKEWIKKVGSFTSSASWPPMWQNVRCWGNGVHRYRDANKWCIGPINEHDLIAYAHGSIGMKSYEWRLMVVSNNELGNFIHEILCWNILKFDGDANSRMAGSRTGDCLARKQSDRVSFLWIPRNKSYHVKCKTTRRRYASSSSCIPTHPSDLHKAKYTPPYFGSVEGVLMPFIHQTLP